MSHASCLWFSITVISMEHIDILRFMIILCNANYKQIICALIWWYSWESCFGQYWQSYCKKVWLIGPLPCILSATWFTLFSRYPKSIYNLLLIFGSFLCKPKRHCMCAIRIWNISTLLLLSMKMTQVSLYQSKRGEQMKNIDMPCK